MTPQVVSVLTRESRWLRRSIRPLRAGAGGEPFGRGCGPGSNGSHASGGPLGAPVLVPVGMPAVWSRQQGAAAGAPPLTGSANRFLRRWRGRSHRAANSATDMKDLGKTLSKVAFP